MSVSPVQIIETAVKAVELAYSLLGPDDQDRLAQRIAAVQAAKKRVRDRAQAALDRRRKR